MKTMHEHGLKLDHLTEYTAYPVHMERLNWLVKTIQEQRALDSARAPLDSARAPLDSARATDDSGTRAQSRVRILDVGCGTGNITIPLGMIPNSEVVGIDMYQPNIDLVNERNTLSNVRVTFSRLSDFDVSTFDFILFSEVLEHIPGYRDILEDLSKRMKPDAQILVTIPNGWGPFEWAMQPMYIMRRMGLNGFIGKVKKLLGKKEPYALNQEIDPHVNFFTRKQIKNDCAKVGLELVELEPAFLMAPIMETYTPFISLNKIAYLDNKIAHALPVWLASGWYYRMRRAKG